MGLRADSYMDFPEPLRTQVKEKLRAEQQREKNKKAILQTSAETMTADDRLFDSAGEAEYYNSFLRPREQSGAICFIRQQVRFELVPDFIANDGTPVTGMHYTADFVYTEVSTGVEVVVEVKSRKTTEEKVSKDGSVRRRNRSVTDTEASKLRWKLMKYIYRNDKKVRFVKWFRGEAYE